MAKRQIDWTRMGSFMVKFAYYGADYFGLSAQTELSSASYFVTQQKRRKLQEGSGSDSGNGKSGGPVLPTVESTLEKAMQKACLIKSLTASNCSRCGRTDRGVHARGNYLTLLMRLKPGLEFDAERAEAPESMAAMLTETAGTAHYDYAAILNGILPKSVRIIWVKACPVHLDARFHCLFRMYRYYFTITDDMDLELMDIAARQLLGSHNFKNFCKVDPSANKTTIRQLFVCKVEVVSETVGVLLVTGPAFLWHQVRCIAGCLLAIARGTLSQSCIWKWLDVVITPVKPPYAVAPPDGLVLWDCAYEALPTSMSVAKSLRQREARSDLTRRGAGVRAHLCPKSIPTDAYVQQSADLDVQKAVIDCLATASDEGRSFFDISS